MTKEIKLFKELVSIKLKDWRTITTQIDIQQLWKMLNSMDFIVIWDIWIWKYEVKSFEKFSPTEIDCFIYSQPKEIAKILQWIIDERKAKNLSTNWTVHLWKIYEDRYLKNN